MEGMGRERDETSGKRTKEEKRRNRDRVSRETRTFSGETQVHNLHGWLGQN